MEHLCLERIHQRLQLHAAHSHPLCKRGARDRQPGTSKDAFLSIQGQVVCIFGDQYVHQQACVLVSHLCHSVRGASLACHAQIYEFQSGEAVKES